ncbi:hypothetical protein WJ971_21545 [Achromobacter xylosoxidans]
MLRIEGVAGPQAGVAPLSVFGALTLNAPNVEQGGNVFAPLGRIVMGIGINGDTRQVRLLPGSLTSVSAAGLTVPYGGTVDGLSYLYQGAPVEAVGVGGMSVFGVMRGISLLGGSIAVDAGAVIDLSGGGTLAGAGFISGRGGSTDPLFHPLPRFDGVSGKFDLPALSDRPVYAIMPGLADGYAPVAPRDEASGYAGSRPRAGETITIGAGVPGLPAGTYTLLPSYYALLPGAYRVELGQGALGGNASTLRGSWSVAAIRGLSNTGAVDAMPRQALVTPATCCGGMPSTTRWTTAPSCWPRPRAAASRGRCCPPTRRRWSSTIATCPAPGRRCGSTARPASRPPGTAMAASCWFAPTARRSRSSTTRPRPRRPASRCGTRI